jgi:hypothetical protein
MVPGGGEADFYIETSFNMMENLKTMAHTIYYGWPSHVTP